MLKGIRRKIVGVVSSRHVAGRDVVDALRVCRWAAGRGFASIISPWSGPGDTAGTMMESYRIAIDTLCRERLDFYLSIKLDAISYDVSLFDDLIDLAGAHGVRVHIDSLGPDAADKALSILERGALRSPLIGYTLAARWRRSLEDAGRVAELGVPVRIVKGQWDDPVPPGPDCRRNYLAIAAKLSGRSPRVAVATHDLPLAAEAIAGLNTAGTRCEFEQFFSLPLNGIDTAARLGIRYRLYVAYGRPGIPYNVKFTLTRPSIAAWMITDFALKRKRPRMQE